MFFFQKSAPGLCLFSFSAKNQLSTAAPKLRSPPLSTGSHFCVDSPPCSLRVRPLVQERIVIGDRTLAVGYSGRPPLRPRTARAAFASSQTKPPPSCTLAHAALRESVQPINTIFLLSINLAFLPNLIHIL